METVLLLHYTLHCLSILTRGQGAAPSPPPLLAAQAEVVVCEQQPAWDARAAPRDSVSAQNFRIGTLDTTRQRSVLSANFFRRLEFQSGRILASQSFGSNVVSFTIWFHIAHSRFVRTICQLLCIILFPFSCDACFHLKVYHITLLSILALFDVLSKQVMF